jgi:5,8-dihydroxy-2-naphthoate synthase
MTNLDLGFSTCPNDTFIFHAMLHDRVDTRGFSFTPHLHDVEELNKRAFKGDFHITKLSFFAWMKLRDTYDILDSGAALGYGCGPMLVGKNSNVPKPDAKIAIPGEHTTAHLLLRLWNPEFKNTVVTRFDNILEGVQDGTYDAGLIIHEGRFVYESYGCQKIIDLGDWWEKETNSPIPLGCIAVRKDESSVIHKDAIESILKNSVEYAMANRRASRDYVKQHAQELDDEVIDSHIDLYVNEFSLSLGERGKKSVDKLMEIAQCKNIL